MQTKKVVRKTFSVRLNPDIFLMFRERALQENIPVSSALEILIQEALERGYIVRKVEVKG